MVAKIIFVFTILTLVGLVSYGQSHSIDEKDYSNYIQTLIGGEREVSVESGRVDLLTEEYAYEIEWANKWKESIGQTLWYAQQTNKKPGIILIIESVSDYKYFIQLNTALEYAGLEKIIKVNLFPNDFKHLIDKQKD